MTRIARIFSLLALVLGGFAGALALSSSAAGRPARQSAASRPARQTAVVCGYVRLCGGPSPGRCWKEEVGFCQAPKGCVTSDRVAAVNSLGRRVATQKLHHGRFKLRLVPGRYTIQLLGDGKRVHGQVMAHKRVWARAHHTSTVRFQFDVP